MSVGGCVVGAFKCQGGEIEARREAVGREAEGFLKRTGGGPWLDGAGKSVAEMVVGIGEIWLQCNPSAGRLGGALEVSGLLLGDGKPGPDLAFVRCPWGGLAKSFRCIRVAVCAGESFGPSHGGRGGKVGSPGVGRGEGEEDGCGKSGIGPPSDWPSRKYGWRLVGCGSSQQAPEEQTAGAEVEGEIDQGMGEDCADGAGEGGGGGVAPTQSVADAQPGGGNGGKESADADDTGLGEDIQIIIVRAVHPLVGEHGILVHRHAGHGVPWDDQVEVPVADTCEGLGADH